MHVDRTRPHGWVEVIRMKRNRPADGRAKVRAWLRFAAGAAWVALLGWTATAGGAPRQPPREPRAFDLAVAEIDVRQLSSTPMFREVEVRCVVTNKGPRPSIGPVSVVVSRPGDDGPKVLKKIALPDALGPGDRFTMRAETAAWFAAQVPYRCEVQYGESGGDADPSDDYREMTYPRL
jgi:hypothetical protein